MKTYTTKPAKNGATLYYSVETGKRIAKETALENERKEIVANGTVAERYELAKEFYNVTSYGGIETIGNFRISVPHGKSINHIVGGYTTKNRVQWHTISNSAAKIDLKREYNLTIDEFRAAALADKGFTAEQISQLLALRDGNETRLALTFSKMCEAFEVENNAVAAKAAEISDEITDGYDETAFDLLPTVDELNDVDADETDEVTEPEAAAKEMSALESEAMDTHEKLDIKIIEGAPKAEIEELAEHIAALDRRYHELHKVKYGHEAEYSPSTAAEIIADAIELLTLVDSDGNEVKPPAAKMFTDTAEVTDTEHFIQADNEPAVTETELTDDQRKVAEQVCDSMTAAAPNDWSVAFTENGKFAVYSGDSVNVVDTITAGDFLNPKEFFEQFRRKPTQAELDDPNVAALAELNHEREQLLTVRDELAREYPDEVERLKLLDEMIAETDADITALKTFKKPRDAVEFDDKGNVKAVWF